jgi:hypothetical protein
MQGKGAEGLPADPRESLAANEDFAGTEDDLGPLMMQARAGWDPYDVWRTRVKNAAGMMEHETDSRR